MFNAETSAVTYNYGGRTEGIWQFSKGKLFTGADLRIEGAKGTRLREFLMGPNAGNTFLDNVWQNGHIDKTGMFGEYHLETDILQYIFSGRLEINHANIKDPSTEFTSVYPETHSVQINPSFSVGIFSKFAINIQTGLWFGRARRSGSLTERYINYFPVGNDPYEMVGNPLLNPEVNNQTDLTFKWTGKKTAINVDLFASYLQDYISSLIDSTLSPRLPTSPGVRQFRNFDAAVKTGFEINWKQELALGLHHQMGIAYTRAKDLERDEPLPEIAPLDFRYTIGGSYMNARLRPEATIRHVLEQSRISKEFGETTTPAFTLLDVNLMFEFSRKIRFNAGVNNLLNKTYYEHLNRPPRGTSTPIFEPGRNFFLSVNINFN
jgi:iron complex outermembrane receptor protein